MPMPEESWLPIAQALGYTGEKEMLENLYLTQQMSINEIAFVLGYAGWTVRRRLLEYNIRLRSRGGPNKQGQRKLKDLSDDELTNLTALDLAAKYNVSQATVYAERRFRKLCTSVQ
jgi:hypothetical protein